MPAAAVTALRAYAAQPPDAQEAGLPQPVLDALNALVAGPSLYDQAPFAPASLSPDVLALAGRAASLDPAGLAALNRSLLDESFPVALGVAAIAVAAADVQLTRVTVLGRTAAHRLSASDTILRDFTTVDDTQDGCVRFSAYAAGSVLPRQFHCAAIPAGAPIFTSDAYGQPGYAQLLESADTAITGGAPGASISSGADSGSETWRLFRGPQSAQGAGPAHQICRVHAARADARDRACHVTIVPAGAGEADGHGRRPRTSEL